MPTIAIIGASKDPTKFGNKAVKAYLKKGYTVYPIHPTEKEIEGLKVYASILEVPIANIDRVSVYLPPKIGMNVIDEIAKIKTSEVWLNPGSESPELIEKAEKLGLNVIVACSVAAIE